MEYRQLGNSKLTVSAMSPGTMTFGGKNYAAVWELPTVYCWTHIGKLS